MPRRDALARDTHALLELRGDLGELHEGGFQAVDDLGGKEFRRGQGVGVFQRLGSGLFYRGAKGAISPCSSSPPRSAPCAIQRLNVGYEMLAASAAAYVHAPFRTLAQRRVAARGELGRTAATAPRVHQ